MSTEAQTCAIGILARILFGRLNNACRPKNSVNLCESVSNFPSCLSAFVAETQSIKNNKLCKTNPISKKPKMNLTFYSTKDYENKPRLRTPGKQTQSNPIYGEQTCLELCRKSRTTCSELVEPISKWRKPCLTAGTLARSGGQPFRMKPRASFQFNGPVGVVEELLPASVAGLAKMDADERIVLRLGWETDEGEAGLLGSLATFCHVTFCAGTDHIFPN